MHVPISSLTTVRMKGPATAIVADSCILPILFVCIYELSFAPNFSYNLHIIGLLELAVFVWVHCERVLQIICKNALFVCMPCCFHELLLLPSHACQNCHQEVKCIIQFLKIQD